jgi:Cu/Ag efflux protein CusF
MNITFLPAWMRLGVAALMLFASAAFAQSAGHEDHAAHGSGSMQTAAADSDTVNGEVRKVAKDTGRLTIRHEEMKTLGMPAMTMVFRVVDPVMLDQVKPGDKVNFVVKKSGGQYVVTQIAVTR